MSVPAQYVNLVQQAASALGIPFGVVAAQIQAESSWNPGATSPTGAQGLTQFEPGTWAQFGSGNPYNPQDAINAYIRYMAYLLKQEGGNLTLALAAYNAGPGNVQAGMGYANNILANAGANNAQSTITDNSGVSLNNSAVGSFVPSFQQPVLSLDTLRAEAPLAAAIVTSVPELQGIFQQAVSESWSTDRFISALQNSQWWQTHSDTARQAFATLHGDPATWNQTVTNLAAKLNVMAAQLGAIVSNQTVQNLAVDALTGGFDTNDQMLRARFAQYVQPVSGVHFGGEAGTDETTIRQTLRDLGLLIPEGSLDSSLKDIIAGKQTVQGVQAQLRTQAQATYPAYSAQIQQGMNVSDIAAPYIQQAQNLLEQGPGQINIYSDLIKKALQNTVNGQPTPLSLTSFEDTVRQQPQWLQTGNARDSIMTTAHKVLMDMGLAF